ncbi:uncharacterized protein LOC107266965 [Cephus cinctus]|uniref:Uncharacterized protein LOC107266965 n=1 Tax=Cephus cinctus TaxID=211228 RepID=A0AAJ7FIJ5_CEPCN|nr:uncharacterized protein LOC107266965 [Cephus cinctus]
MKCFVAILLVAFAAVSLADKAQDVESIEPTKVEAKSPVENVVRDKRGFVLGAAYTAPYAYSAYSAPVAYSAGYSLPYAYSAYSAYPYYTAYSSPYVG